MKLSNFSNGGGRGVIAVAVLVLAQFGNAHTWLEEARIVGKDDKFIGLKGYPRGWTGRGDGVDQRFTYRVENGAPDGTTMIKDSSQAKGNQKPGFPALNAQPGDTVALLYLENGHVTNPRLPPDRQINGGTVYIYGTSDAKDDDKLFKIHKVWNSDGTGGDKRGRLLATRNYDDGSCHQGQPATEIAAQRPNPDKFVACQSIVTIPKDAPANKPYTLYWVWDYPHITPAPFDMADTKKAAALNTVGSFDEKMGISVPDGVTVVPELYICTLDVLLGGKGRIATQAQLSAQAVSNDAIQNVNSALPNQMSTAFLVKTQNVDGDGKSNGPGDSGKGNGAAAGGASRNSSSSSSSKSAPAKAASTPTTLATVSVTAQPDTTVTVTAEPVTQYVTQTVTAGKPKQTGLSSSASSAVLTSASSQSTTQSASGTTAAGRPEVTGFMPGARVRREAGQWGFKR